MDFISTIKNYATIIAVVGGLVAFGAYTWYERHEAVKTAEMQQEINNAQIQQRIQNEKDKIRNRVNDTASSIKRLRAHTY